MTIETLSVEARLAILEGRPHTKYVPEEAAKAFGVAVDAARVESGKGNKKPADLQAAANALAFELAKSAAKDIGLNEPKRQVHINRNLAIYGGIAAGVVVAGGVGLAFYAGQRRGIGLGIKQMAEAKFEVALNGREPSDMRSMEVTAQDPNGARHSVTYAVEPANENVAKVA